MNDTPEQDAFEAAWQEAQGQSAETQFASPQDGQGTEAAQGNEPLEPGAFEPPIDPAPVSNEIWSNAPEEARAAYEAAQAELSRLRHRVASDDGRVARYQRERDAARSAIGAISSVSEKENLADYLQSEEWNKVKTDYGDDLKPIFRLVETLAERNEAFSERFTQMDEMDAEAFEVHQQDILTQRAPDWRQLIGSDQFAPWLEAQPRPVQEAFGRNFQRLTDIDEAAFVVDQFRASMQGSGSQRGHQQSQLDQKRAVQLDASRSARSRMPAVADTSDDFEAIQRQAMALKDRQTAAARR